MPSEVSPFTFPLVEVAGTSFEMGYQHGQQAGNQIHTYLDFIENLTGKSRAVLCRNASAFLPLIQRLSSQLVDEITGLAKGADISFDEALLCQARGEAARVAPEGCTAFALTGSATEGGITLAGQNQDLDPAYEDVAILLRLQPSDGRPRALIFTFAGQLGYSGMNEHGLAHFANALYDAPWRFGLPHYPLKRVLLEQNSLEDCLAMIKKHPTCSAGNMVFCFGNGQIADVEIRPDGFARFTDTHPDSILHANHYLTPEFTAHETNSLADSCLDRIKILIHEKWGSVTVDTMKRILADHQGDPAAICRHGAKNMISLSGYIAEPDKGLLHVRRGLGCTGTWTAYDV
ncbi:MAG: C45 family autoproteolytic acyltransferase/hydrolase [bacterium]|nr:C45 family autoproteolytic acyltransferase/hydrolase [bacterium]